MKPVIREYLASLKERDELDAVLPDLLSEMGFIIYSRPSRGPRQYGVDFAGIGPGVGDRRKVFLFSIKQGDLTRAEWDAPLQGLRPSLNEILDVYVPMRIPPSYRRMKIVICICFGGDIQENVRDQVTNYTTENTTSRVSFEEWNGDRIAGLIEQGLLREELLPRGMRSSFRKAVAMLDEPDISFEHFSTFVRAVVTKANGEPLAARITAARQICVCLWILFVWARDAGNLESPFRASELAMLQVWHIVRDFIGKRSKASEKIGLVYLELADLHFKIWDDLIGKKIVPHAGKLHAVSMAVGSGSAVDINLRLFDLLGRVALRGLWLAWTEGNPNSLPAPRRTWKSPMINQLARATCDLAANNPVLLTPLSEGQATDLMLALMFLTVHGGCDSEIKAWVNQLMQRAIFAFKTHGRYLCVHTDYRDLLEHPKERTDEYRRESTSGSVLYPVLAVWAAGLKDLETLRILATFKKDYLPHCNYQGNRLN